MSEFSSSSAGKVLNPYEEQKPYHQTQSCNEYGLYGPQYEHCTIQQGRFQEYPTAPKAMSIAAALDVLTHLTPKYGSIVGGRDSEYEQWDTYIESMGLELSKKGYAWTIIMKENLKKRKHKRDFLVPLRHYKALLVQVYTGSDHTQTKQVVLDPYFSPYALLSKAEWEAMVDKEAKKDGLDTGISGQLDEAPYGYNIRD